jgi:hypothetical protein
MGESAPRKPLREWLRILPAHQGERLLDALNPQHVVFYTASGIPVRVRSEGGRIVIEATSGHLHVTCCGALAQIVAVSDPDLQSLGRDS